LQPYEYQTSNVDLLCPEDALLEQIKINRQLQIILMTIPIDKKAQEKDVNVLLFTSISATDLAQRLCGDHNS